MQRAASNMTIISVGAIVVIIAASGLYLSGLPFQKTTSTAVFSNYPLSAETSDSTIGLQLRVILNSSKLMTGEGIRVSITEMNILNSTNNVTASNSWPLNGLALGPCGTVNYPIGIGIFQGYFTGSNISSAGKPLSIYNPGEYMCPMILTNTGSYEFQPMSDSAQVSGSCTSGSCFQLDITSRIDAGGYWNLGLGGRTFENFPPGTYTVIGGDEWGQLVILHFVVSSLASLTTGTTIGGSSGSLTTTAFSNLVLTSSKTYTYDSIPPFQFVGNFSIQLLYSGTGYTSQPSNGTSTMYTGYSFAFNVTTPAPKSTYMLFGWIPPCLSNLGLPCQTNNETVLPSPENETVNYHLANLLIMWYKNTTGLYVSFQEYDQIETTTPSAQSTLAENYTPSVCTAPSTNVTGTVTGLQYFPNNQTTSTFTTYTTTFNHCG